MVRRPEGEDYLPDFPPPNAGATMGMSRAPTSFTDSGGRKRVARPLLREAVSGVTGEGVAARSSTDNVARCPVTAVDRVGATLPEQHVLAAATADRVTARLHRGRRRFRRDHRSRHGCRARRSRSALSADQHILTRGASHRAGANVSAIEAERDMSLIDGDSHQRLECSRECVPDRRAGRRERSLVDDLVFTVMVTTLGVGRSGVRIADERAHGLAGAKRRRAESQGGQIAATKDVERPAPHTWILSVAGTGCRHDGGARSQDCHGRRASDQTHHCPLVRPRRTLAVT